MEYEKRDKVRVLMLGDPGVGKSTLMALLCHGKEGLKHVLKWTVGCQVDVLHHHARSTRPYFIELFDIGSCKHKKSRLLFYKNIDALILVYDATNSKSHQNLWRWLLEYQSSDTTKPTHSTTNRDSIPILVVGMKMDISTELARTRPSTLAEEYGGDSVMMSIQSFDAVQDQFLSFFDKVIDKRYSGPSSSPTRTYTPNVSHVPTSLDSPSNYTGMYPRKVVDHQRY